MVTFKEDNLMLLTGSEAPEQKNNWHKRDKNNTMISKISVEK